MKKTSKNMTKKANGGKPAQTAKNVTKRVRDSKTILSLCLCGCNQPCKRTFLAGHDAKLKSIILKVSRQELPESAIPQAARDSAHLIKFADSGIYKTFLKPKKARVA